MSTKKYFLSLIVFVLMVGCQPSSKTNAPQEAAQGGVDGSGGNLTSIERKDFDDLVTNKHKYFVRDVIHRIFLVQKNSPDDFFYHKPLAARFVGDDEVALMKLVNSIEYYTVSNSCPSSDHPTNDGATNLENSKICISYDAFKRFSDETIESQLLILTLHEISHLRGFNEDDAVRWQSIFTSFPISNAIILTNNKSFVSVRNYLSKLMSNTTYALNSLISNNEDLTEMDFCYPIRQAANIYPDMSDDMHASLPFYIIEILADKLYAPLLGLSCEVKDKNEIAKTLAQVLENYIEIQKILENYETPLCVGELCAFRRGYFFEQNAELSLSFWAARKNSFLNNLPYELSDLTKIKCQLTDLSSKETTIIEAEGNQSLINFNSSKIDVSLGRLFVEPSSLDAKKSTYKTTNSKEALISLVQNGPLQIIESKGFSNDRLSLIGSLGSGTQDKEIHVHFAAMEVSPDSSTGFNNYYLIRNALKETIQQAPRIRKEFYLSCRMN